MILFVNVFLTDMGFSKFDRGLLPNYDPINVFKYTMASYSVINWSNVIIYYDVENNFKHRIDEIDQYIHSLFQNPIVYHFRNEWQIQWKTAMIELFSLKGELVWYVCNHDHVFIDSNLDMINSIKKKLNYLLDDYPYVSCSFSHWVPSLNSRKIKFIEDEKGKYFKKVQLIEDKRDFYIFYEKSHTSLQILNKRLLYYWWFENDYGDGWMPRSDTSSPGRSVNSLSAATLVPYKEIVRHFDGDAHLHLSINIAPPLFIPEGFFNNDIKILYCKNERKKGYVHINPFLDNYSAVDANGADMKCVLEDIPLFWKQRISTIEVGDMDENVALMKRNEEIIKLGSQQLFLFGRIPIPPKKEMIPDKEELTKILAVAMRSKTDTAKAIQEIKDSSPLPKIDFEKNETSIVNFLAENDIKNSALMLKNTPGRLYSRLLFIVDCFSPDYLSSYVENLMKEGESLFSHHKIEQSVFTFLELLYYDIENVLAWNNLGVALEKLNMVQEAMNAFNYGLRLKENSHCLFNKAILIRKNSQNSKELMAKLLVNQKTLMDSFHFLEGLRKNFSNIFQYDQNKMIGKLKWLSFIQKRGKKLTDVG